MTTLGGAAATVSENDMMLLKDVADADALIKQRAFISHPWSHVLHCDGFPPSDGTHVTACAYFPTWHIVHCEAGAPSRVPPTIRCPAGQCLHKFVTVSLY